MNVRTFAVAASAVAALQAQAQETYTLIDNFSTPQIDSGKWLFGERSRIVKANALSMAMRDYGDQISNAGTRRSNWNHAFDEPHRITQMRVNVVANSYELTSCAANATAGSVMARLYGGFFNTTGVAPGDQTNDVLASIRLIRLTSSTDAVNLLRVQGSIDQCTESSCATSVNLGLVELGTVSLGTQVRLTIEWDQMNKRFMFQRDLLAFVPVTYSVADSLPPNVPLKYLNTRTSLQNCLSSPRTVGAIDATFDYVLVNASGTP